MSVVEYQPISSVRNDTRLDFDVPETGKDYIDIANILLYVRAKITRNDGTALAGTSTAAPVNLMLHSVFFSGGHFSQRNPHFQLYEHADQRSGNERDTYSGFKPAASGRNQCYG